MEPRALDTETILSILKLRDPLGVLSVYVDLAPEERTSPQTVSAVSTRNALRELEERLKAEGPRERWAALAKRLGELKPAVERLLDPREPGRGRALFASLAGGAEETLALQLPLRNRVVLEDTPYVRPLVAALDAGRPVGLATVSRSGVRVDEWRLGQTGEVTAYVFEEETEEWRELKGPREPNPAMATQSFSQRDRFERRLEEQRERFLASLGGRMSELAGSRGWHRLVLAGDDRLVGSLAPRLGNANDLEIIRVPGAFEHLAPRELAEQVAPYLEEAWARRALALAEAARDAALGGGAGALGLADTLAALAEGRVSQLLYDESRDYEGSRAPDGRLFSPGVVPAGVAESELTQEPWLAERMIERALETGAEVTPLHGPAAEALATGDGVAALLRW